MIELKDIFAAYKRYDSVRRKTPEQTEFRLFWPSNCLRLYESVRDRRLSEFPFSTYAFIVTKPRPREVFGSDVFSCILHHYIDMRVRPILERKLSPHTYNNRKGKGQIACQNAVASDIYEVSKGFTRDAWIVKVDFKGCFPNISQDKAYEMLRELIEEEYHENDKDELLYILQHCIFSYPTKHCELLSPQWEWEEHISPEKSIRRKPDGVGAAIGLLLWQMAVGYYFHSVDELIEDCGVLYERYVDDIYMIMSSKAGLSVIPEIRRALKTLDAALHPHKFYCQHYTKGCECLGTHIKMDRMYPNTRIIKRAVERAKEFNHCIRPSMADRLIASMNSYFGICKGVNGYNQAMKILRALDERWFRYVVWDDRRLCLRVKPEYSLRNRTIYKYDLL